MSVNFAGSIKCAILTPWKAPLAPSWPWSSWSRCSPWRGVGLALAGGGDETPDRAGLRVERSGVAPELIVYVAARDNVSARAQGARTVTVRCVDAAGRLVVAAEQPWPFGGTDEAGRGPHAHLPLDAAGMSEVDSCRLEGTEPLLEGPVR